MRFQRGELKKARIEIIPMIDTIFFLLVFFMMASLSMVQLKARRVRLPTSATASERPHDQVVVTLDRTGQLSLDRQTISTAHLLPLLSGRVRQDPAIEVVINCDRMQRIARFVQIFDLVKQSNATNVMIATEPQSRGSLAQTDSSARGGGLPR